MLFTGLLSFAVVAPLVAAAPSAAPLRQLVKRQGATPGHYIVRMKEGSVMSQVTSSMSDQITAEWELIHGFSVKADEDTLNTLLAHPDVESVEEDGKMEIFSMVTQSDAPWGLGRLSSDGKLSGSEYGDYPYTYDDSAGEGVDIYVIDTGVFVDHPEFEGRARWGTTFGDYADADGNGHGTHVAGIAASRAYGVAKKANIIAIKTLSDDGFGFSTDTISALDWVAGQVASSGRPSIINMSYGGGVIEAVDAAVEAVINQGIHFVAAAGNGFNNAHRISPAHVPRVVTVAAIGVSDWAAPYSNYGTVIDLYAPGSSVRSTWIGSQAHYYVSGTSQAAPHVAGLIAYFIALDGNMSPEEMSDKLKARAYDGVLEVPVSYTTTLMAHQ